MVLEVHARKVLIFKRIDSFANQLLEIVIMLHANASIIGMSALLLLNKVRA
jgi:hypothetical protein